MASTKGFTQASILSATGNRSQLEFDLAVKPGADPGRIRLKVSGARRLALENDGTLVIQTAAGDARLPLPLIYQENNGQRYPIGGRYVLRGSTEVGFQVVYSAMIGGTNWTYGQAIAVDSAGNSYIVGTTNSSDSPTVAVRFHNRPGGMEGFVTKIDATGTSTSYSIATNGTAGYTGRRSPEVH